ncbi:MAG: hypothetical protein Q7J77_09375 [Undibacterium sp.]|nr:hypothetical protein [Undibacterium sp.]
MRLSSLPGLQGAWVLRVGPGIVENLSPRIRKAAHGIAFCLTDNNRTPLKDDIRATFKRLKTNCLFGVARLSLQNEN